MKKQTKIVLTLSLFFAAGILLWINSRPPKRDTPEDVTYHEIADAFCTLNTHEYYSFDYNSHGIFYQSGLNGNLLGSQAGDTEVKVKAKGTLHIYCAEFDPKKKLSRHTLVIDDLRTDHQGLVGGESLEKIIGQGIYFERSAEGTISRIKMPQSFSVGARNLIRDFLNHFSVFIPADVSADTSWLSIEYDGSGRYEGNYNATIHSDVITVNKKRSRYLYGNSSIRDSDEQLRVIPDPELASTYQFSTKKVLKSIESKISLKYQNNQKQFASTNSSMKISWEHSQQESSPYRLTQTANVEDNTLYSTDLKATDKEAEMDKAMNENTLGNTRWDELATRLQQEKLDNSTELFLKLKAFIALNPIRSHDLAESLLSLNPESEGFLLGLNVLVNIGHDQAQSALLELLDRATSPKGKLYTLSQIGLLERAEMRVEEKLRQIISSPDNDAETRLTARLALGNIARAIGDEDPARQEKTTGEMLNLLQSENVEGKYEALLSLGNIGSKTAYDKIEPFLKDPDLRIRLAAMKALRFIDSPSAEKSLNTYLDLKFDEEERLGAVQELGYRHLSSESIEKHKKLLAVEKSEQVSLGILANLGLELKNHPELKALFEEAAQNNPSRNVRNYCQMKLAQLAN